MLGVRHRVGVVRLTLGRRTPPITPAGDGFHFKAPERRLGAWDYYRVIYVCDSHGVQKRIPSSCKRVNTKRKPHRFVLGRYCSVKRCR